MFSKKYYFLTLLIVGLLGIFSCSHAAEYGSLGGRPAYPKVGELHGETWLIYKLEPGKSMEDGVEVMNLYEESWEALIYAADTTHSSGGGFALKQFSEPKESVGNWVKFYTNDPPEPFNKVWEKKRGAILELCQTNREDLQKKMEKQKISDEDFSKLENWCKGEDHIQRKMEAKEKIIIPFIITIPDSADVGEHTGGILIQKVAPETQEGTSGSSIKLTTRVGIRIYETVPGEVVKKITLESFEVSKNFREFDFKDWFGDLKKPQEYLVQTKVKNEGNASLEYKDNIHIKDLIFKKRNQDVERGFQVLKKDIFSSNFSWQTPRFGWFSVRTESKYQDQNGQEQIVASPEIKIWIIPWREIAITFILFLIGFAVWIMWKFYQKKKYGGIGWVKYETIEGDTLVNLAGKCGLDWKVLAKTNKIKAPFVLAASQSILVPPILGGKENTNKAGIPEKKQEKTADVKSENSMEEKKSIDEEKFIKEMSAKLLGKKVEEKPRDKKNDKLQTKELKIENFVTQKMPIKDLEKETFSFSMAENIPGNPIEKKKNFFEKIKERKNAYKPEKPDESDRYKRYLIIMGIALAVLTVLVGTLAGILIYKSFHSEKDIIIQSKLDIPAITPPAASNISSEEVANSKKEEQKEISCADLEISVLNGTEIAGEAGKMKENLEKEGCGKINAGNAKGKNYQGISVYYQKGKTFEAEKVKSILEKNYAGVVIKPAEEGNGDMQDFDFVIILGK